MSGEASIDSVLKNSPQVLCISSKPHTLAKKIIEPASNNASSADQKSFVRVSSFETTDQPLLKPPRNLLDHNETKLDYSQRQGLLPQSTAIMNAKKQRESITTRSLSAKATLTFRDERSKQTPSPCFNINIKDEAYKPTAQKLDQYGIDYPTNNLYPTQRLSASDKEHLQSNQSKLHSAKSGEMTSTNSVQMQSRPPPSHGSKKQSKSSLKVSKKRDLEATMRGNGLRKERYSAHNLGSSNLKA
jgi:hypothetical protein